MKLVYFSVTGNTRRFVRSLPEFPSLEITPTNPFVEVTEPFVFLAPAYEREVTDIAWDFLATGENARYCQGILGSGNLNFDQLYIFTAKDLARDFGLPLLDSFEYFGTPTDTLRIKEKLNGLTRFDRHPQK